MNGYWNDQAMGVYTNETQLDFDPAKLASLGFAQDEIQFLQYIIVNGGKVTTQALNSYGLEYEAAKRIRYMYDIMSGKVKLECIDDLVRHLRKMNPHINRVGIQNLALSTITEVPRKAMIAGIKDPTFAIWNSANLDLNNRMYHVTDVSGTRIFVETKIRPVLKFKQSKSIEGILEIVEEKPNGKLVVAIDKKYCRLCNRFVIVASTRRPEFHFGMLEIICIEGSKVYVYAQKMGVKAGVKYNGLNQRVYDFGYIARDIHPKLMACATALYKQVCGVYATTFDATDEFSILVEEKEQYIEEEPAEIMFD